MDKDFPLDQHNRGKQFVRHSLTVLFAKVAC